MHSISVDEVTVSNDEILSMSKICQQAIRSFYDVC